MVVVEVLVLVLVQASLLVLVLGHTGQYSCFVAGIFFFSDFCLKEKKIIESSGSGHISYTLIRDGYKPHFDL